MHLALSGHWTVLAALFLYVRREPPRLWMWPLLIALTSAIHATLLAMVLALWARIAAAAPVGTPGAVGRTAGRRRCSAIVVALAVLWTVGFFGTGSYGSYGYGDYKLNLLWPILTYGWSQIFPDLPHTRFDYEGLSFLGIGILVLLALAIVTGAIARLRHALSRALAAAWPWSLLALMVFAFSKELGFGPTELVHDPGARLHRCARLGLPLHRPLRLAAALHRHHRRRCPRRRDGCRPAIALPVILVALAAQAVELVTQVARVRGAA